MAIKAKRKVREGVVKSDKMEKTIVVSVVRSFRHPLYKRIIRRTANFKAHDEKNECKAGDRVRIVETKPLSATKRWRLLEILERAKLAQ
ncbi:MAG: 30S ribosomal protein S17 [candidate division FCPU426 bacterium]